MLLKALFIFILSAVVLNPLNIVASDDDYSYKNNEHHQVKGVLTNYFDLIKYSDVKKGDIILFENSEDAEVFIYRNNGIASRLENGELSYDIDVDYIVNEKELSNLIVLRFDTDKFTNDIQEVLKLN